MTRSNVQVKLLPTLGINWAHCGRELGMCLLWAWSGRELVMLWVWSGCNLGLLWA